MALELDIAVDRRAFRLAVELTLADETLALAGPSGAGKSTLLRAVAGLERPARGRIALDGRAWFDAGRRIDLPPEHRSVGLVFQEYALFPHLSVRRNVAFGGRVRVEALLDRFGIAHLAEEPPGRLSGGERQRVALARALARDPAVLLLDEPLAALDAQTREVVRGELVDLVEELRLPTIVVTHDWTDAAALGRRTCVLVDGRPRQIGTPAELVAAPADAFVASFTGGSLLPGVARPRAAGGSLVELRSGGELVSTRRASGSVGVVVYPWEVELRAPGSAADNVLHRPVTAVTPEGGRLRVRLDGLTAECPTEVGAALGLERGRLVGVHVPPERVRLLPGDAPTADGGG